MKKHKKGLPALLFLFSLACALPTQAATGWQQDSAGQWFYMETEKKVTNQWVSWPDGSLRFVGGNGLIVTKNWVSYENERYYVKEDGIRYENEWFGIESVPARPDIKPSTTWYYAGPDGKILRDGWYELDGKYYYFYPGGNSPKKSSFKLGDDRYYADENGARYQNGWFSITNTNADGIVYTYYYYANSNGTLLTDGWHLLDGKTYYFDVNGISPRKNWVNIGDYRYYVDENGVKQQGGWFTITGVSGNGQTYTNWYYADPENGLIKRWGWNEIDGKWSYFDNNGLSYRNRWYTDAEKNRYYMDSDGIMQSNGWFKISAANASTGVVTENWYYADENGSVLKNGYHVIEGKKYYFDANGTMYKSRWMTGNNGTKRYLSESGALYENRWFSIEGTKADDTDNTKWYYAGEEGKVRMDGWYTIDGKEYHFNAGGDMSTGWLSDGDTSNIFYCGDDGARLYGWQWLEIPDQWLEDSEVVSAFVSDHGKQEAYFYFSPATGKKKRCISGTYKDLEIDGATYCFDTYGIMQTGWLKVKTANPAVKGYKYYVPDSSVKGYQLGQLVENDWMKVTGPPEETGTGQAEYFYFGSKGEPVCAAPDQYLIKKIQEKRYAFDMNGNARHGLLEIAGDFYYFGTESGKRAGVTGKCMLKDGAGNGKEVFCFNSSGKGVTGIRDGYFYYKGRLQRADAALKYEVFEIPDYGKRLVNSSGKVMKGTHVKDADGQEWIVDASGVITKYGSFFVASIIEPEPVDYDS